MLDRLALIPAFLGISAICMATTARPTPNPAVDTLIRDGVALFDAGDLAGARLKLEAALAMEPANITALFELSYTHMAAKSLDPCLMTTAAGLALDSPMQAGFFVMRGSCLSDGGRLDEAIRTFRQGLDGAPRDPMLNYNIAIALLRHGDKAAAVDHLERAVLGKPDHRSALYTLGLLREEMGQKAAAVGVLLRFMMLEPTGERAGKAAGTLLATFESTVKKTGEGSYEISVPTGEQKESILGMSLALSAAATAVADPDLPLKTEAQKKVDGLGGFVQIAGETNREEIDATLWKIALEPLVALDSAGLWDPFGHRMLAATGNEESLTWLAAHPAEVTKLDEYLQRER